jgi:hypothetical protein
MGIKWLLDQTVVEKDVESVYRSTISSKRKQAFVSSPYGTDGILKWDNVILLLEAKYDKKLKSRPAACEILAQCLYYLKKCATSGDPLPNVIMIADRNECLVFPTSVVQSWLAFECDWGLPPSSSDPILIQSLVNELDVLPFVHDIDENFDLEPVLQYIERIAENGSCVVKATPKNIVALATYFLDKVLTDKKLGVTDKVDVFLQCLFSPVNVFLHPNRKGMLSVSGREVLVSTDQYKSFFSLFQRGYTPLEVEEFYTVKDRLVEEDTRRRQGAFFTPKIWADKAHETLDEVLGSNWRDECIVWDSSCGTGNLTKDYRFKDLLLSTCELADVNTIKSQGYNRGAEVFQYDFLNDQAKTPFMDNGEVYNVLSREAHARLTRAAAEGKRLVFFGNPPYGTASNGKTDPESKDGIAKSKAGIADTKVGKQMKASSLGAPSSQLCAQFMFRSLEVAEKYGFKRVSYAVFSKPTFMSSGSYKKLRHWWYARFENKACWMGQASDFSDVSDRWGITFSVWNEGKTPLSAEIPCDLLRMGVSEVQKLAEKAVYNSDVGEASTWVRQPVPLGRTIDHPQMGSGLVVKEHSGCRGAVVPGFLLYLTSAGNTFQDSGNKVFFTSSCGSNANGLSVLPTNFRKAVALFSARKLIAATWYNDKDEYLIPDEQAEGYDAWVDSCHVYTLLHSSNNCTSMRDVLYKEKLWQIRNNFYWKSKAESLSLYNTSGTPSLYSDCRNADEESYFASQLPCLKLNSEASACMDCLNDLFQRTLPGRENFAAANPDYHLSTWDAGVYQLRLYWKEYYKKEWEELRSLFRVLEASLQDGVYRYGFLKGRVRLSGR